MYVLYWIVAYLIVGIIVGLLHEEYDHQFDVHIIGISSSRRSDGYIFAAMVCAFLWPWVLLARLIGR